MNRNIVRLISLLAILALFSIWAFGQTETGQITGTIRDASGAVVSGAKVTVKSVNTGVTRDASTNSSGIFTVSSLRPDTYEVTIEAGGFQKVTRNIEVTVGGTSDISTQLAVTGGATTVEVTGSAEAAAINTENQTLSQVITSKQVMELPTLTRNPYDLVGTAGNVTEDASSARGAGYSINGLRSASTNILLDGGQNVDEFTAGVGQAVPLDSVQEFSVLTNNFTAEYGRASGGVVNVVTKSGTNTFHGGAYEYNRVSALSSNTYQNDADRAQALADGTCLAGQPCPVGKKGVFDRNQFGFDIGGPIIKNKLFFFSNTEWIRVRSASPTTFTILDPASVSLLAPDSQAFFAAYGKPAPGLVHLGSFPCNATSGLTCDSVSSAVPTDAGGGAPQNTWMEVAKVDWDWTDKTTLTVRYASYKELDFPGYVNSSPYAGYNTGQTNYDQNWAINLTHVFSSNLVNSFKVIYNRINGPVQPLGSVPVSPTLYIAGNVPTVHGAQFVFPGYVAGSPGVAIPFGGPQNLYQFYDDISWSKGKHQFKFGGSYIQTRDNRVFGAYENAVELLGTNLNSGLANLISGNLHEFEAGIYPQGKYPCVNDLNTGAPIVTPACTLQLPVGPPAFNRNYRYNDGSVYGQDSWKVSPRLTLSLGLRWEYYGVQHNANQALDSNFVLGSGSNIFDQIRNGSVKLASQGGVFWHPDYDNFAPRVGFAWDIFGDGSTSLRGGFGMGYERNFGNVTFNAIQNPPNYGVIQLITPSDIPVLPVYTDNSGPLAGTGTKALPHVSQRAINQNIGTAYARTWDMAIERQLTRNTILGVDYAGSQGIGEYDIANVNPTAGGGLYLGDPGNIGCGNSGTLSCNRLNQQYSNMNYRSNQGYSNYNAVNLKFSGTNLWNKGLNLTANYTWSHALDNLSSTFSDGNGAATSGNYYLGYLDAFNPSLGYGNADYDIRQRFVVSGTWDLPWLRNSSNGIARAVLGGWSLGSIYKARSGQAYGIYDCTNSNDTSCPAWIPTATTPTGGGSVPSGQPNLFNYLALPVDSSGGIQNLGVSLGTPNCTGLLHVGCTYTSNGATYPTRNGFFGPNYWNMDFNAYKNFKLTERFTMQFRGEFYNIFNHHNQYITTLNLDASSLGSPFIQTQKGGIYGYAGQPSDERRNVQFALKLLF